MTTFGGIGDVAREAESVLRDLGVPAAAFADGDMMAHSPITGETIGRVRATASADVARAIASAEEAFRFWRKVPAPRRGELVRLFGEELRANKALLARLVTLEAGKIVSEGLGEVQEMIDICDFAVGLSRQLHGLTIATERPGHRMMETWHPFGVVAIITSFNFPVAVWAWNAALALVCGDAVLWKPSEKTPLTALATQALFVRAAARYGEAPEGLSQVLPGGREVGAQLVEDGRVRLVSATGSTAMGCAVAPRLAQRFARAILELGGNNAAIVCPSASLELATRAIAFAAMGTAGQRCTTLRRLIVHEDIYAGLMQRLRAAYASARVGDPRESETLIGPLIDEAAYVAMQKALEEARSAGGVVLGGERILADRFPEAFYVTPALVELSEQVAVARRETFAPILYRHALSRFRAGDRDAQWRGACARLFHLLQRSRRGRSVSFAGRLRLRHRQCEYRSLGRRNRRRFWRRKRQWRRARSGLRRLEGLHAARDQHDQLLKGSAVGAGCQIRSLSMG